MSYKQLVLTFTDGRVARSRNGLMPQDALGSKELIEMYQETGGTFELLPESELEYDDGRQCPLTLDAATISSVEINDSPPTTVIRRRQ